MTSCAWLHSSSPASVRCNQSSSGLFTNPSIDRIDQFIKRPAGNSLTPQDLRALTMLVYIVSLLGEHGELDQVKERHQGTILLYMLYISF